jgi:hypothetical protein
MDNSRKHYAFYFNKNIDEEAKLMLWLEDQAHGNYSKYIKEFLQLLKDGKLTLTDQEDLQRKKMLVDIELKEIIIKIKQQELIYKETFEQNPPIRHTKVMKINVENKNLTHGVSCIDEKNNRIMCPECGACFVFAFDQHDKNESKQNFVDHFVEKHGLKLTPEIQKELNEF